MKYSSKQHLQYLIMLDKNGINWLAALGGRSTYRSSAGWRLLTSLWRYESVKITEAYTYIQELMGTNSRRAFVLGAIRDGLIECDDKTLVIQLRSKVARTSDDAGSRRGLAPPNVWLSKNTRKAIDDYFDEAVDELVKTATIVEKI